MSSSTKRVKLGSLVKVRFEGDATDSLLYISDNGEGPIIVDKATPMGHALIEGGGRRKGEYVEYKTEKAEIKAKVTEVIA